MSDRMDEFKGNVKKGLGDLTRQPAAGGRGRDPVRRCQGQAQDQGAVREAGGVVKEGFG